MARSNNPEQPAKELAARELDGELAGIAATNIDELRARWRTSRGVEPPTALSKDLLARALAYWRQEAVMGGAVPRLRKLLDGSSNGNGHAARRVKVGSIIVREYQGTLHEVLVVPDGFCWQDQIFPSLSTIARKITGTSWNGPRFFGLRGAEPVAAVDVVVPVAAGGREQSVSRTVAIRGRPTTTQRGGRA